MNREFKAPKRVTIEITHVEDAYLYAEAKRLGIESPDVGGWVPGPRETILKKLVTASRAEQPSDSEKIAAIMVVMDDWPGSTSEKILADLKGILNGEA